MLNGGFHAEGRHGSGTVRFMGAHIGGRLLCDGGRVDAAEPGDLAINLSQTHVTGETCCSPRRSPAVCFISPG